VTNILDLSYRLQLSTLQQFDKWAHLSVHMERAGRDSSVIGQLQRVHLLLDCCSKKDSIQILLNTSPSAGPVVETLLGYSS